MNTLSKMKSAGYIVLFRAGFWGFRLHFFSMFPTVMNKLKTDYTIISVVLGNTRDFMAFWCDNPEHTNTVFRELLTEGYRNC